MASENFYSELPVLADFQAIANFSNYAEVPENWHIIVADIENSTGAIQSGLYKAVNILGVSVITSVLNVAKPLPIPYIFGGDGAVLCIPDNLVSQARKALIAAKVLAFSEFGLQLRVGIVPVNAIQRAGYKVLVAKHRVSKHYVQAAFTGGGIEYAEALIKDDDSGTRFRLDEKDDAPAADFSGLECRWDNVPSKHGETIALIVKAIASPIEKEAAIYDEIITKVQQLYGNDDVCRPVYVSGLKTTFDGRKLRHETNVRTFAQGGKAYIQYWLKIRIQNVLGWVFMTFNLNVGGVPWGDYKSDLVSNTDFKKFDGVLRQVLSGTPEQRKELTAYLEDRFTKKECVYGIHSSSSALITCLISKRSGDHYHFVDGSDGGYAMAAAAMKEKLKTLS